VKDPYGEIVVKQTITPASRSANTTVNGSSVDRVGTNEHYQGALVVVSTGTITDGTHTVAVEHSDDNSAWSAASAAELRGSNPAVVAADDNKIFEIGYIGLKRYLRVSVTTAGATTGGVFGADIVLTGGRNRPPVRP
jgi:hypothetical protein